MAINYSKEDIAEFLNYNNTEPQLGLIFKKLNSLNGKHTAFSFIDLFAGIGGIRLAFEKLGGECVFTSEWDINSQRTYYANFGDIPAGDINNIDINDIPQHNILLAGFPCQAFSVAGYRKGFQDTRGTLFFNIAQILDLTKYEKPEAILLENVKGLKHHDGGKTYSKILQVLKELGYVVFDDVLNSMTHANMPQNRERIFFVGIREDLFTKEFMFPEKIELTKTIHDFIDSNKQEEKYYYLPSHRYYKELANKVISKDTIYQWRRHYVRENKNNVCPTLTANMGTGGHNVPIIKDNFGIRKLTPRECANFQGFPKSFILPKLPDSKLYYQIGNSVTVPVVFRIARRLVKYLNDNGAL
jgi:DNA (cytosine-5)-methyltransferase 1